MEGERRMAKVRELGAMDDAIEGNACNQYSQVDSQDDVPNRQAIFFAMVNRCSLATRTVRHLTVLLLQVPSSSKVIRRLSSPKPPNNPTKWEGASIENVYNL
eukprot:566124-Amphidinium_carterae.1